MGRRLAEANIGASLAADDCMAANEARFSSRRLLP
jgi:hypothetical protein